MDKAVLSFIRASAVVNCQFTLVSAASRAVSHAFASAAQVVDVVDASRQTLSAQDAQLDLRHIQPTAVLGRVVELEPIGQPLGLGRVRTLRTEKPASGC